MTKFELPPDPEPLWTPRRIRRTVGVSIGALILAGLVGTAYGAWTIFQPAPLPMVGPVPTYLLAGAGLAIAAGWCEGRRVFVIEHGYGDPGRGLIVAFTALAISCVGVWSAYESAEVHTPAAAQQSVPPPAAASPSAIPEGQTPAPAGAANPRPLITIPGSQPNTCGAGVAQACSNLLALVHDTSYVNVKRIEQMCQLIATQTVSSELAQSCAGYELLINDVEQTKRTLVGLAQVAGLPEPKLR